jgi:hypothetical protein
MRTSTKLKKLCENRECGLLFTKGEWRLFYPDTRLGEAVFSGKTFSKVVSDALGFMNKKENRQLPGKKAGK